MTGTRDKVAEKMADLRVADAMTEIFNLFRRCNRYIDETMPWVLAKDEASKDRLATVLYNLVEGITIGASLLSPYMPETSEKIFAQLNTSMVEFDNLATFGNYKSGTKVTEKPQILFARLDELKDLQKAKLKPFLLKRENYPHNTVAMAIIYRQLYLQNLAGDNESIEFIISRIKAETDAQKALNASLEIADIVKRMGNNSLKDLLVVFSFSPPRCFRYGPILI